MGYLGAGVITLGLLYLAARAYTSIDPAALVRAIRYTIGIGLILFGGGLALAGRWGLGLFIAALGVSALVTGRIGPIDLGGGVRRSGGTGSTVRSSWFDMRLDHDTGAMTGEILKGIHVGKSLDDIPDDELLRMYELVASDADSAALLEAYFDRRLPGWRDHVEDDGAPGSRGTSDSGPMTDEQAYEILGLLPGAGEAEIRAAHRKLMLRVHPDQGGSTFLAAKINQAKDWLLGKHR